MTSRDGWTGSCGSAERLATTGQARPAAAGLSIPRLNTVAELAIAMIGMVHAVVAREAAAKNRRVVRIVDQRIVVLPLSRETLASSDRLFTALRSVLGLGPRRTG